MICGIYKITSPSGKVYIGQTVNMTVRKKHYRLLHCKQQRKLYSSLIKYGWEAHRFEVIHELAAGVGQKVLDEYEILYIRKHEADGFELLNLQKGGKSGGPCEESKVKMSESKKGQNNPMFGRPVSPESNALRSQTMKGRKRSDEVWNKGMKGSQVAWNKGIKGVIKSKFKGTKGLYKASDETKKLLSIRRMGNKNRLGKSHSEADRKKISDGLKAMHAKKREVSTL